jgi:hypothetical protein
MRQGSMWATARPLRRKGESYFAAGQGRRNDNGQPGCTRTAHSLLDQLRALYALDSW